MSLKILIVSDLFPPDKGVSVLRIDFFYRKLSEKYDVSILKKGLEYLLVDDGISTYDEKDFNSLPKWILRKNKIHKTLSSFLNKFDLIIVSVPKFQLLEIVNIAKNLNKKIIVDLRDQIELIYDEKVKRNSYLKIVWKFNYIVQTKLYNKIINKADSVLTVGSTSAQMLQTKLTNHNAIYNIHNGFEMNDLEIVSNVESKGKSSDTIEIGLVGSIHDFRASNQLELFLKNLDKLSKEKNREIIIKHWGKLGNKAKKCFDELKNVMYLPQGMVSRDELLKKLKVCNYLLLITSDSLIWEPTTTVFDYILLSKPVIFVGLYNNEAYNILENCGVKIIRSSDAATIFNGNKNHATENNRNVKSYSREYSFSKLNEIINTLK